MRVIGGLSRGRRLPARLPDGVRPTADRVREAIFDILGSMGGVEGLSVVDLCCGSGALGIEARSRGAAAVTFVDHDPGALEAVRVNLAAVGLAPAPPGAPAAGGRAPRRAGMPSGPRLPAGGAVAPRLPAGGAVAPGITVVRGDLPGWLAGAPRYDLALCDPPYSFDRWGELLAALRADVAVLESPGDIAVPAPWMVAKSRRYGGTLVTVVRTVTPEQHPEQHATPPPGRDADAPVAQVPAGS